MSWPDEEPECLTVAADWERVLAGDDTAQFEATLPAMLVRQRWFGGKARRMETARLIDAIPLEADRPRAILSLIEVVYGDGTRETYGLPVAAAFGEEAALVRRERPQAMLARLISKASGQVRVGVLYDALWNDEVARTLLGLIGRARRLSGRGGVLVASATPAYRRIVPANGSPTARVMQAEQSNTSVLYGTHAILKLYRRLRAGVNPDVEIGQVLTANAFPHSAPVGGWMEYVPAYGEPITVGMLQQFVPNRGDAWAVMREAVESYLSRLPQEAGGIDPTAGSTRSPWELAQAPVPEAERRLVDSALDIAACLGRRTGALHRVLAEEHTRPDFVPEPMTEAYCRTRCESMRRTWKDTWFLLERRRGALPAPVREDATQLLERAGELEARAQAFLAMRDGGLRIRCHGDYHLGQVLWTGSDYVIIDFEGEPARPLSERRTKHSPLLDVAGMLRSLHYASCAGLVGRDHGPARALAPWTECWFRWVGTEFLRAYLAEARPATLLPSAGQTAEALLTAHMLEKAIYELSYELNNRPEWVAIPLKGILHMLNMTRA